jgi:hypothetical protein
MWHQLLKCGQGFLKSTADIEVDVLLILLLKLVPLDCTASKIAWVAIGGWDAAGAKTFW